MNRSISMLAALLLLVVAVQPVTGACCTTDGPSRMMATMPCCAGNCTVMRATTSQGGDNAILTASVAFPACAPAATIAAIVPLPSRSIEIAASHQESPPPFLLHEQFRI